MGEYGRSKLEGEKRILASGARALILRTSWVYGSHGRNFLLTILRLARERPELRIVSDQWGAPTSARQIAEASARILAHPGSGRAGLDPGLYHMTASGLTSWHGFAQAIVDRAHLTVPPAVLPISTAEYPTPARRPLNSALSNEKFAAAFGFRLRSWEEELSDVMLEVRHPNAVS